MKFCVKCHYQYNLNFVNIEKLNLKKIDNIKDLEKYEDNEIKNLNINIKESDIEKSKLDKNKKELILNQIKALKLTNNVGYQCNNCGNIELLNATEEIYSISNIKSKLDFNVEKNKIIFMDYTLPRTKDYLCKNPKCGTHKDSKLKEAVFYRNNDGLSLTYLCGECYYSWSNK